MDNKTVFNPIPLIDRLQLEEQFTGYRPPEDIVTPSFVPYQSSNNDVSVPSLDSFINTSPPGEGNGQVDLKAYENYLINKQSEPSNTGTVQRSLSEIRDDRYAYKMPGSFDNEDAYAQNQHWTTKMVNGVSKGLVLTGTTFLQTTFGTLNGLYQAANDGRWASFYDNEFNRGLDEINKELENILPSYETKTYRDAAWYSPDYFLTGNFLWEGVVKNLGFAAGAALSGGAFSGAISWAGKLAGMSRLASSGKMAEVLANAEMVVKGGETYNKVKRVSDLTIGSYKALSIGERAVVAGLATTGEAGIEAYHGLNEYRETAIKLFEEEFGRFPNQEELRTIDKAADEVGNATFKGNMALLSATNYIQFPTILGSSYKAEKGMLNELAQKTNPLIREGGKYATKAPSKFQKFVIKPIKNPYIFSYSEAFEEGAQFAIGKSTEDYFDKKYNPDTAGQEDWFESIYAGVKETVTTDEGMKNVLIGGLSGGLMLSGALTLGRTGRIAENRQARRNTDEALRSGKWDKTGLNSAMLSDFTNDTYDAVNRGVTLQQEREAYVEAGDIVNAKDTEADYIINYLSPRIKHGRYDLVLADINDYQTLAQTEEGWTELVKQGVVKEGDTKEAFLNRLTKLKETANNVKSLYQSVNLKYRGALTEDGNRKYPDEVLDKMVYASSKIADYTNRYNQLSAELMGESWFNLDEITASIIVKDDSVLNETLQKIQNRTDITDLEKEDLATKLSDLAQIVVRRQNFIEESNAILREPGKYTEKTRETIKDVEEGKVVKIKTGKEKEKEVVINEPYYLVENYKPSRDGVRSVRKAHKVKLLKQNPDGSVEVEFENGTVKTVTPEQMAGYNLGKVSDTENNKKAKFVLDHLDETFKHLGVTEYGYNRWGNKKDEPAAEGVLEYDSDKKEVVFVWTDPKGNVKTRTVTGEMFRAKEGYQQGMIVETGERLSQPNSNKAKSKKAFISLKEKKSRRSNVANELYENLLNEVQTIAKKIEANNKRLSSLDEEIANAYKTKSGQPRKRITKKILETVSELEKLKETIPVEIERLQNQQTDLEGELEYVKSFVDNVDSTPDTGTEMINNLKEEMKDLEDLISLTKDAIKQTERQLPLIEAIYQRALKLLNNFIERMVSLNPGIPLSMEEYRDNMASRLGDEVAEGIIDRGEGFTSQILDIENTILSYTEGLKFPQYEDRFLKMSADLKEMQNSLKSFEDNLRAQEKILNAFREFWKKENAKKAAEEVLVDNAVVDQQLDSSLDTDGGSANYDPDFQPTSLKANRLVTTATRGVDFGREDQKRANDFGFNLPKLQDEGKEIQAVYVTSATEEALGIPGLMNRIAQNAKGDVAEQVDQDDIIAVVMVTETEDGLKIVDSNGDPITEGEVLDQAIYQVMPAGSLVQKDGTSMFRPENEGGPSEDAKKQLVQKYKDWRTEVLARTKIDSAFVPQASFGRLQYEQDEDGENIYDLRTPVSEAGFIEDDTILLNKGVLVIPTTELSVGKGTTEFKSKSEESALYKRVFIDAGNGLAQVKNKQVSESQVKVIFRAIKALAQDVMETESLSSKNSLALLSYLKGVIYFGIPKTQKGKAKPKTTNSVFFKKDKTTNTQWLYIGQEQSFEFTPTALEENYGEILEALKGLYTNTNKSKAEDLNERFEEILEISDDGEIQNSRTWPNYQSYLLSKYMPVEAGNRLSKTKLRPNDEIPLVTSAKPITESEPVNRKDIYFYNEGLQENYTVEETEKLNFRSLKRTREAQGKAGSVSMESIIAEIDEKYPAKKAELSAIKNQEVREEKYSKYFIFSKLNDLLAQTDTFQAFKTEEEKVAFVAGKLNELLDTAKEKGNTMQQTVDKVYASWFAKFGEPTEDTTAVEEEAEVVEEEEEIEVEETPVEEEEFVVPEGYRIVEEGEVLPAGDFDTRINVTTGERYTNAPKRGPRPIRRGGRRSRGSARVKLDNKNILKLEDWKFVETWLKANLPQIPFFRMENIIKNTAGNRAMGLFLDGAMYVYKNAEEGTAFHEAFEAVWATFATPQEKVDVLNEFKNRKGTFLDRPTGKNIAYKDATDIEAKEAIAEEFRQYVMKTGLPQKTSGNIILRAFKSLVKFIRTFINKINGKAKVTELFEKINTGGYRSEIPESLKNLDRIITDSSEDLVVDEFEGEFSMPGVKLSDSQKNDVVNELIYQTIAKFLNSGRNLFSFSNISASDEALQQYIWNATSLLYEQNDDFLFYADQEGDPGFGYDVAERTRIHDARKIEIDQLVQNITNEWPSIKQRFAEKISQYDITFDENDQAQIESEEKTRNSDYVDATKVDKFKKMNKTLKLIFSNVAKTETYIDDNGKEVTEDLASSIGGAVTIPFTRVTNTLMKKLHKSVNLIDMMERFQKLATENPDYRTLYKDFTGLVYTEPVSLKGVKEAQDMRLLSGMWKTFSLAAPAVKNVFILEDGSIEVGDASLSTEAIQLRNSFIETITLKSKSGTGFFKFSSQNNGVYQIDKDALKKRKLDQGYTSHSLFLRELGIDFSVQEMRKLSPNQWKDLKSINSGMRASLNKLNILKSFSSKTLDLHRNALLLGLLKASVSNPAFESTYFNVAGERTQTFIGTNATDRLYKILSQIDNITELEGTEYEYLIFGFDGRNGKDTFTQNSAIIKAMFDEETGDRIENNNDVDFLTSGYAGGTINNLKGKNITSSKLKLRDRLTQEINLNLKGWYMNLVPGDSSTEWMTYMGNFISKNNLATSYKETFRIMKGYFIDEVNLAREENRDIFVDRGEKVDVKRKELRFFKDILDETTLTKIKRSRTKSADKLYEENQEAIERAILRYVKANSTKLDRTLRQFGLLKQGLEKNKGKVTIENTSLGYLSSDQYDLELDRLSINYMIANIEMHKVLYGDPYQYKDELKRTKSFQSPRQEILNSSPEVNTTLNDIWNKAFAEGAVGRTDFLRDYFNTITFSDVTVISKLFPAYGQMDETDGAGIISLKAYRNFKIRASDWTDDNELQYQYEMKYMDLYLKGNIKQAKALKNPKVRDTFTAIKPVVTGNRKHNSTYNKIVLDKYSLYPVSFRTMIEMEANNGVELAKKMEAEDIDYVIFKSGRKVGAYNTVNPYNEKGEFISEEFPKDQIVKIPFYAMGLQTEVPSKDKNVITRGSQVTKIITMDRMDAGMPLDYMPDEVSFSKRYKAWNALKTEQQKLDASDLYKEIVNNRKLLQALTDFGYQDMLIRLGIKETKDRKGNLKWIIENPELTAELIKNEVLTRDTNDNIVAALNKFMKGSTVLEATPAYRQISNILYSIVDKNIARPKMNGQMKVQIPSTFWEENRIGISEFNGKKGYTSDALGFYSEIKNKDGKRTKINVMEIYAGRWFKSDMSDEELLEWLNTTEEGQKALEGFAFRIPTQNMNSIDAFRIKKFLPEEFGDNVVVPSALVGKVGSDFDIDKLSMYLKNIFVRWDGKPVIVPNFDMGEKGLNDAIKYVEEDLKKRLEQDLKKQANFQNLFGDMATGLAPRKTINKWVPIFREWYAEELNEDGSFPVYFMENMFMEITENIGKKIEDLTNEDIINDRKVNLGRMLYKQGLQNAYMESNINLLTHPSNYEKLTSPNDASSLEELSNEIVEARGETIISYKTPINMLDRTFMTQLRNDFVGGKQGIGIAATGQTNNAINQLFEATIDADKLENVDPEERRWLGKADIKFAPSKYNFILKNGKRVPTLSMRKNKAGNFISDTLGMFIDGFVDIANGPWIMRLGATPEVVSTWLFLLKVGVPIRDVAYFMNQPIIREYMQLIQNKGYSWLFIDTYVEALKEKYESTYVGKIDQIPSVKALKETINKSVNADLTLEDGEVIMSTSEAPGRLSNVEKAYQTFYLDEFLKYSMMGRHLFYFIQGTNYDTASFNNPYLLTKKAKQFEAAQNSIISDANKVLDNSFLGVLKDRLLSAREALKEVLISDKPSTRAVVEKTLEPYINMNDRDYVKMAEKVITSLFDWAVQTHTSLNRDLERLLIDKGNIAQKLNAYIKDVKSKPNHPLYDNYLIQNTEIIPSKSAEPGSPDNVKIKPTANEVYEQNRMIYAFRELREELGKDSELYQGLVKLAILQNGLSASTMSFTSYIPFEDFEPFYNQALSLLEDRVDLSEFNNSYIFQRNNWHNGDVTEYKRAKFIEALNVYNPGMGQFRPPQVNRAVKDGDISEVLELGVGVETRADFIVYTWEDYNVLTPDEIRTAKARGLTEKEANRIRKKEMKDQGDYSFLHKALMKKVYNKDGTPFEKSYTVKKGPNAGKVYFSHVYRAINAWGMGNRANEYYSIDRPSVINNGFDKVPMESSDADIIDVYSRQNNKSAKTRNLNTIPFSGNNAQKVKQGLKTTTVRNYLIPDGTYNVDGAAVKFKLRGLLNIEEAGGVEAITKSEAFGPDGPMYDITKKFLKGEKKLYVYDLNAPVKTSSSGNAVLNISIKNGKVVVNNKTMPMSFMNTKQLLSLGYTQEQAEKIINEVNDPLKGCE